MIIESNLQVELVIVWDVVFVGDYYLKMVKVGQIFCILDLEGNQVVDMLFYNVNDIVECYSVMDIICEQGNVYFIVGI